MSSACNLSTVTLPDRLLGASMFDKVQVFFGAPLFVGFISMALETASKETIASLRSKFERNCSFRLMFSSRVNSYSDNSPLRISPAGSAINEFMIELLSSIVVEFSRLTLFRRCGRDSNFKDVAIIDVALEDIRIYSVNSTFIISKISL
jgi:hypothetical protein